MCVYAFRMNLLHAYTKFTRVFCMHAQKFEKPGDVSYKFSI